MKNAVVVSLQDFCKPAQLCGCSVLFSPTVTPWLLCLAYKSTFGWDRAPTMAVRPLLLQFGLLDHSFTGAVDGEATEPGYAFVSGAGRALSCSLTCTSLEMLSQRGSDPRPVHQSLLSYAQFSLHSPPAHILWGIQASFLLQSDRRPHKLTTFPSAAVANRLKRDGVLVKH